MFSFLNQTNKLPVSVKFNTNSKVAINVRIRVISDQKPIDIVRSFQQQVLKDIKEKFSLDVVSVNIAIAEIERGA